MATENDQEKDSVLKEKEHVHNIYSQIAPHFSDTRYKPWPRIAEFLSSLPSGSNVADIGCGNGKYLGVNKSIHMIGCDMCPELVSIAKGQGHEVLVSDCLSLPFRDSAFDAAICIAVLHHLSTEERRAAGVREIMRVLRPGGVALLYVWAMEQTKKKFDSQDAMVPWHMQLKYLPNDEETASSHSEQPKVKKKRWRKKKYEKKSKATTEINDSCQVTKDDADVLHGGDEEEEEKSTAILNNTELPLLDNYHFDNNDHTLNDHTLYEPPIVNRMLLEHISVNKKHTSNDHDHHSSIPDSDDVRSTPTHNITTDDTKQTHDGLEDNQQRQLKGFKTYYRYYHVFCEGELVRLCESVKDTRVKDTWYDHENWCVLLEKKIQQQ